MQTPPRKNTKHTLDDKLEVIRLHHNGYSGNKISKKLHISKSLVQTWINLYRTFGVSGLEKHEVIYLSGKLKIQIVRDVLENSLSCRSAALKYHVSETSVRSWKQKVLNYGYDSLTSKLAQAKPSKKVSKPKKKTDTAKVMKLQNEILRLKGENFILKRLRGLNNS